MSLANKKSKVYVELDCLLDTRLGTIAKIDPELVATTLTNEDYYTRDCDEFEGIDKAVFKEAYANRDKETLALSGATGFCLELGRIVLDLVAESHHNPLRGQVSVVVNVYPYQLTDDEKLMIKHSVTYHTQETVDIDIISLMPTFITADFFREDYVVAVFYDYQQWFESQMKNIAERPLLDLSVIAPRLFYTDKPTDVEELKEMGDSENAFAAMELLTRGCFDLNLVDVQHFCIIPPNPTPSE